MSEQDTDTFTELGYFRTLAPIPRDIYWQGRKFRFYFHILGGEEERDVQSLTERAEPINEVDRALCEVFSRLALSIVSVDGKVVEEEHSTLMERYDWVSGFPSTLIDELISAYQTARLIPLTLVDEKMSDPNTEAARMENGSLPGRAEPTTGES